MVIDFCAHFISRSVAKMIAVKQYFVEGKEFFEFPPENADPKERLRIMGKYGVDMQVLSMTTPTLLGFRPKEAAEVCKVSNDSIYELCESYPDKFVGIVIVSLLDVDSALEELDRAIKELGLKGVTISTNQNGRGLDSPEYFSFYDRVVKYDVPIFLHPTNWESYPLVDMETGYKLMHIFGWPFDTTQAVCRLIFSGILEKYPSLKIVTHHLGGMLPYFSRRLEWKYEFILKEKFGLRKHLSEYSQQIYGDTALDGAVTALKCGYDFFGPDHIVFGTDYPFGPERGEMFIRDNLAAVKILNASEEDKNKILEKNAKKLLKL